MNRYGKVMVRQFLTVSLVLFLFCLVSCNGSPIVIQNNQLPPPPLPPAPVEPGYLEETGGLPPEYNVTQVTQFINEGDYQGALAVLEQAKRENPAGNDVLWWQLGQCYEKQTRVGGVENAIDSYRRLVKRFSQSSYFYKAMNRLVELKDRKPFVPPVVRKKNAVEREYYPFPSKIPLTFAPARFRETVAGGPSEYDEDIEAHIRALAADPGNPDILAALAGLYVVRDGAGDAAQALKYSEAALAADPGDPALLFTQAMAYGNAYDYKKAVDGFYKLMEISGEDPFFYYLIGLNENKRGGRNDEAVQALEKALELDPGFVEARNKLDELLKK